MKAKTLIPLFLAVVICSWNQPVILAGSPTNDSASTATVSGVVKFEGKLPAPVPINMAADPSCAKQHHAPVLSQDIVTDGKGESWLVQLSRHQTAAASPLLADTANSSQVVIALTPLAEASGSRGALIDGFVDLTPTERAVLSAFVDGKDIASIASEMQRSIETVRWHVRNLFAKLGVNSQADLTRLGSLLLPI